jgi:NADPH:quinone reductase
MRAVVVRSYGGPEALEVVEVPVPEPGAARSGSASRPPR